MLGTIIAGLVGLLHCYFGYLEIFMWEQPAGRKAFGQSRESAAKTAVMAKNQGLYNLFLAAGIFYALYLKDMVWINFFLYCVAVAGVGGAVTTGMMKIIAVQTLPAVMGLYFLRK